MVQILSWANLQVKMWLRDFGYSVVKIVLTLRNKKKVYSCQDILSASNSTSWFGQLGDKGKWHHSSLICLDEVCALMSAETFVNKQPFFPKEVGLVNPVYVRDIQHFPIHLQTDFYSHFTHIFHMQYHSNNSNNFKARKSLCKYGL